MKVDIWKNRDAAELYQRLCAWRKEAAMLEAGEITQEEYDNWRYNYPKYDTTQKWAKVPSRDLSDVMVKVFKDKLK